MNNTTNVRRCSICGAIMEPNAEHNPDPVGQYTEDGKGGCCAICEAFFVFPARSMGLDHAHAEAWAKAKIQAEGLPSLRDVERWQESELQMISEGLEATRSDRAARIAEGQEEPDFDAITEELEAEDQVRIDDRDTFLCNCVNAYAERLDEIESERKA